MSRFPTSRWSAAAALLLAVSSLAVVSPCHAQKSKAATRLELARVLSQQKDFEQAIAEYEKVLAENPENAEARIGLSKVHFYKGDPKKALEVIKPLSVEQMNPEDRLHYADLLASQKQYAEAEKLYLARLEQQPDDLLSRLKLADIQSWTKRYDAALQNFEAILKARPDDKEVRRKYGMVLSWAGRRQDAIEQLRRSLDE